MNPVLKLYHFNNRLIAIYKKNGFKSIPFDSNEMAKVIETSEKDLTPLFVACFGKSMAFHLLDKFFTYRGDIFEFYGSLDTENKELFCQFDW